MKEIKLTRGYTTFVPDDKYVEIMTGKKWHPIEKLRLDGAVSVVYARRDLRCEMTGKRYTQYLHRFIMGVTDPKIKIDHRDGNGLNNTYENLRIATQSNNMKNSRKQFDSFSKFKGVSWRKDELLWVARILVDKKSIFLGYHKTEEDAARAYDKAALQYFKEYAWLNFPTPPEFQEAVC